MIKADKVEIDLGGISWEMVYESLILMVVACFGLFLGKQLHWAASMTIAVLVVLGVSLPDAVLNYIPAQLVLTAVPAVTGKRVSDDTDEASTSAGTDVSDSESDHDEATSTEAGRIPIKVLLSCRPAPAPATPGSLQAKLIPGKVTSPKAAQRLEAAAQRSAEVSARWAAFV